MKLFAPPKPGPIVKYGPVPVTEPAPRIALSYVEIEAEAAARQYEAHLALKKRAAENRSTALMVRTKDIGPNSLSALDSKLEEVYYAIANGAKVINLEETFIKLGVDDLQRPKIAVAQADWRTVYLHRQRDGYMRFAAELEDYEGYDRNGMRSTNKHVSTKNAIEFPVGTLRTYDSNLQGSFTAYATVPLIPAGLRPDQLSDYHIIFEPLWHGQPVRIVDPILVKRIGGMLYKVIVAWDVSPIEQAILRGL